MTEEDSDSNFYTAPKGKIAKITIGGSNMGNGKAQIMGALAFGMAMAEDFEDSIRNKPRRKYNLSHEERLEKDKKKAEKKRERQNRKRGRK